MNRTRPLFAILKSKIKRPRVSRVSPPPRATFLPPRSPRYTYSEQQEDSFFTKSFDLVKDLVFGSFAAMGLFVWGLGTGLVFMWGFFTLGGIFYAFFFK